MKDLIQHILEGGLITSKKFIEPVEMHGFSTILDDLPHLVPFDELDTLEIHYTKDQLKILSLEEQVESLKNQLSETKQQKKKLGENLRETQEEKIAHKPYRSHLTRDEVKEIEQIFKRDFSTQGLTVSKAYGVSAPVMSRIKAGIHAKSSANYIRHLKHIGQYKG